jgi:predicted dithiol-disulfide oxidoreductase (DUF899 family)
MIGNLDSHKIVQQEEWLEAPKRLLTQEKRVHSPEGID